MNQCAIQQNMVTGREEMRTLVSNNRDHVFCPKPRRLGLFTQPSTTLNLFALSDGTLATNEALDPRAASDIFDIILPKIVTELPTGTNWNFDVHWYSKIPRVISASSFDGKIGIYNIEVLLIISEWDECNFWLATLKRMIKDKAEC